MAAVDAAAAAEAGQVAAAPGPVAAPDPVVVRDPAAECRDPRAARRHSVVHRRPRGLPEAFRVRLVAARDQALALDQAPVRGRALAHVRAEALR